MAPLRLPVVAGLRCVPKPSSERQPPLAEMFRATQRGSHLGRDGCYYALIVFLNRSAFSSATCILIAIAGCGRIGFDSEPVIECPPTWRQGPNGVGCYRFDPESTGWGAAEEACEACEASAPDAHLVVIDSQEEHALVTDLSDGEVSWIGLSDRAEEGTLRWVTGAEPKFTMYPFKGLNNSDTEDCVDSLDEWFLWECDLSCPFVCELDGLPPDPTAY